MTGPLSREEIALRILTSFLQNGANDASTLQPESLVALVSGCFDLAIVFENKSTEVGGRPVRSVGRKAYDEDDD